MSELSPDPRFNSANDYLKKIVAQLASIVSRLDPEATYEACARADDERNKRLAALEAKVQGIAELQWSAERAVEILGDENRSRHSSIVVNAHNISQLQDSINKIAGRLEALEKHNRTNEGDKMAINDLHAQVRVLDIRAQTQAEITNGLCSGARKHDAKLGGLTSALNDLHGKLANLERNAVFVTRGVVTVHGGEAK